MLYENLLILFFFILLINHVLFWWNKPHQGKRQPERANTDFIFAEKMFSFLSKAYEITVLDLSFDI